MRRTLTVRLIPTTRTDLLCLVCGRFRTEAAVLVGEQIDRDFAEVGIHRRCIPKRAATSKASAASRRPSGEASDSGKTQGGEA